MRTAASAPAPPSTAPPAPRADVGRFGRSAWLLPASIAAAAVALRVPAYLSLRHLSFDDGVYGASAMAMRAGGRPFRDVFSSQGPLFLPLVWLADLVGLRTLDAPRLLALGSGLALVLATWSAARALDLSRPAAGAAAGLVGTSGSVLWVTGPLTSDGPSLALATGAVAAALWYRRAPTVLRALLIGLLIGAALAVKSLLIAAAVPVGLVLLRNRRHLAAAVGGAAALGLAAALPWGLADVWDQAVRYHLEAAGSPTPVRNLRKVISTLGDRDLPLLLGALLGTVAAGRAGRQPGRSTGGVPLVAVWLAATVVVLALEHPLWRNHVAHLIPPAALLVAAGFDRIRAAPALRTPTSAVAVAAVGLLVVPYHLVHTSEILWPASPSETLAAVRADLRALPPEAWVISDDPGVVWRAGRRTPGDLVDTSILRIESGRLTAPSLARAANLEPVCAVLVWSSRFGGLATLPQLLEDRGYHPVARYGGPRVLYTRADCAL